MQPDAMERIDPRKPSPGITGRGPLRVPHPTQPGTTMHKIHTAALCAAISLAFCTVAAAADMSKDQYKSGIDTINAQYKQDRAACKSFAANAKDICVAQAKGKQNVAKAQLEDGYKPTSKTRYDLAIANAKANYAVAMERCDDKAGNDKDVCVKQAKASQVAARADASAQLKTANANQDARDTSSAARNKAGQKTNAANQDAAAAKRDADYAVAKEKCDAFAGDAKDNCLKEAKGRFGN